MKNLIYVHVHYFFMQVKRVNVFRFIMSAIIFYSDPFPNFVVVVVVVNSCSMNLK